jgi:hypothetical protein
MTVVGICKLDDCAKSIHARDMCGMHYSRWRINGDPLVVNKAPWKLANVTGTQKRLERIEDYQWLRRWGASKREACERMGISRRTAERYNKELRECKA